MDGERARGARYEREEAQVQPSGSADILYLVDRLEELVSLGKRVPFSARVMVEEDEFLALVDQLRVAVPNEIKQAQRVIKERERIIGEAQDEAAEIVDRAHAEADRMVSQSALLAEAKQRGEEILRRAEEEHQRTKGELDVYVLQQAQLVEDAIIRGMEMMQGAADDTLEAIGELRAQVTHPQYRD
jgi:vacuolar-type H+-ATPase subunit H